VAEVEDMKEVAVTTEMAVMTEMEVTTNDIRETGRCLKVLTVYSSMHGHIRHMTDMAVKEGAGNIRVADVRICSVWGTLPEALKNHGHQDKREEKQFSEGERA
jgi:hypothetical protein